MVRQCPIFHPLTIRSFFWKLPLTMKIKQWLHIVRVYKAAYKFHQRYPIYNAEKAHFVGCQDWNIMECVTSSHDSTLCLYHYPSELSNTHNACRVSSHGDSKRILLHCFPCLSTHFSSSLSWSNPFSDGLHCQTGKARGSLFHWAVIYSLQRWPQQPLLFQNVPANLCRFSCSGFYYSGAEINNHHCVPEPCIYEHACSCVCVCTSAGPEADRIFEGQEQEMNSWCHCLYWGKNRAPNLQCGHSVCFTPKEIWGSGLFIVATVNTPGDRILENTTCGKKRT